VPAFNPTQKAERVVSAQMLSVQGPMARTVRDVRLGLAAMAQRDPRDPWWVPAPLEGPALPRRVAVVREARDLDGAPPCAAVMNALESAADALHDAGYEIVDERTPGFTRAAHAWFRMQATEFRLFMQEDVERDGDEGIRTAMRFMLDRAGALDQREHLTALKDRAALVREWNLFLDRVPLVLAPVSSELPYRIGFDLESVERTGRIWSECATLMAVPVLGLPGMAVPTGVADGLPVGVQIIGPRFREDLCLAAAEAIEARLAPGLTPIDPR
jgi:amidase